MSTIEDKYIKLDNFLNSPERYLHLNKILVNGNWYGRLLIKKHMKGVSCTLSDDNDNLFVNGEGIKHKIFRNWDEFKLFILSIFPPPDMLLSTKIPDILNIKNNLKGVNLKGLYRYKSSKTKMVKKFFHYHTLKKFNYPN